VTPRRIALTGGIATGKSYCLEQFRRLGAAVIDADTIARDVVAAGTTGFDAVVARFGASVLDASGALDRATLGTLVFHDAEARRDLEAIIHPLVYEQIERWFRVLADHASDAIAIADIPLLYETNRAQDFERVVVAACSRADQVARLRARGMSAEEADLRLAAQLPIEEKARKADYVIETSRSMAETDRQVMDVWKTLIQVAGDR
jgi:dephospho-CoA kinase